MSCYHIVVLGDGGVGKTFITFQITANTFVEEYDPTIEDIYRKQITVDGVACLLEILDTAGREEFTAMRDESIRKAAGFVIVYSITSLSSFEQVDTFIKQVFRAGRPETNSSIIIVGNKVDLQDKRQVSTEQGAQLVSTYGLAFFETSAKTRKNIAEVFIELVRNIRKKTIKPQHARASNKRRCFIL